MLVIVTDLKIDSDPKIGSDSGTTIVSKPQPTRALVIWALVIVIDLEIGSDIGPKISTSIKRIWLV